MTGRSGPGETYWQEIDNLSGTILEEATICHAGLLIRMHNRDVGWKSPNFFLVSLHEHHARLLGRTLSFERVLYCGNLIDTQELTGPALMIDKSLHFEPSHELLTVRTRSRNPGDEIDWRDILESNEAEDAHGLSIPTDEDYELLLNELRIGKLSDKIRMSHDRA